jgi:hypothetical protein
MTNTQIKQPKLLAEQERYCVCPHQSPRGHKQTAAHDLVRFLDGVLNCELGDKFFYSHHGNFDKRVPSRWLILANDIQFDSGDSG